MEFFCPNCEVKMVAKLDPSYPSDVPIWNAECSMCWLGMRVQIYREPRKTYDEVTEDFNKIPLTDSQRGSKKGKK